jgi:hypothetical protein
MIQISSVLQTLTLNQGDAALEDLSPGITLGYFAVICDGSELQLLDNDKAKALRSWIKARKYYEKHGVLPVAVFWQHNKHVLSTLLNLGYLCVLANAKDVDLATRELYCKVAETTDPKAFAFKVCYWLRLPLDITDDIDVESVTRGLVDTLAFNGATVIELDAGVIKVKQVVDLIRDPVKFVNDNDQNAVNQPGEDMKYIDFKTPDLTHPIEKTLPLVVPEGVLDIHEKFIHVVGLGN